MNERKALGKTLEIIIKDNFIEDIKGLKFNKNSDNLIKNKEESKKN